MKGGNTSNSASPLKASKWVTWAPLLSASLFRDQISNFVCNLDWKAFQVYPLKTFIYKNQYIFFKSTRLSWLWRILPYQSVCVKTAVWWFEFWHLNALKSQGQQVINWGLSGLVRFGRQNILYERYTNGMLYLTRLSNWANQNRGCQMYFRGWNGEATAGTYRRYGGVVGMNQRTINLPLTPSGGVKERPGRPPSQSCWLFNEGLQPRQQFLIRFEKGNTLS